MRQSTDDQMQDALLSNVKGLRQAFGSAAYETAEILNRRPVLDPDVMAEIWRTRAALLDDLVAAALVAAERNSGRAPACATGCTMCCYQHIVVSSTEAFWIAQTSVTDAAAIAGQAARVRGTSHEERYRRSIPCVFLKEKRCSIYEQRPQVCRTYFSLSRTACQRDWDRRLKPSRDHWQHIPIVGEPQSFGTMIDMGSDYALLRACTGNIQLIRGELAAMLEVALRPGAFGAWVEGEAVFPKDIFRPSVAELPAPYHEVLNAAARNFGLEA